MRAIKLDEGEGEHPFIIGIVDREMICEVVAEALVDYKEKPRFLRLIHILETLAPNHPAVLKERRAARRQRTR